MNATVIGYVCFAISAAATFTWLRLLDTPWGEAKVCETPGLLWIIAAGPVYRRRARIILACRRDRRSRWLGGFR